MTSRGPLAALAALLVASAVLAVVVTRSATARPSVQSAQAADLRTAGGSPGGAPDPGAARHPRVELIGDSITEGSRAVLVDALDERYDVVVDAVSGRTFAEMLPAARSAASRHPDHVIINLGANDVLYGRPRSETEDAARSMIGAFEPGTCVHIVTVSDQFLSFGDQDRQQPARDLDAWLAGLATEAGHPVIDWAELLRQHRAANEPGGAATVDSIHPTPLGQQILAGAYVRSLASCRPSAAR